MTSIDAQRLLGRIRELGGIGRDGEGRLVRLAASHADRLGRDRFVGWLREAIMARLAPAAIIFVPSAGGISHNPREHTADAELVAGANILLDVVARLADQEMSGNG
ncbi:hypothetical protein FJW08_24070 [Mesorhizobium sp. B3-2-1]|nr:hypothetical protein FJW08_24070 [Mesorhizobium sp. B3-2-1]